MVISPNKLGLNQKISSANHKVQYFCKSYFDSIIKIKEIEYYIKLVKE